MKSSEAKQISFYASHQKDENAIVFLTMKKVEMAKSITYES